MNDVRTALKNNQDFIIENLIPRQKQIYSAQQAQTCDSFGFKWQQRDSYESAVMREATQKWLEERYALDNQPIRNFISEKKFLDAGCGSGYTALLLFGQALNHCRYIGVDISCAVDVAATRFAESGVKGEFIQASITDLPNEIGNFDVIYSEGVLHHTDSTEKSLKYLATKLNPHGLFMFYVYNLKGPVREFTDDYIRNKLRSYSNEEAWEKLKPLTKLGKQLGDLNIEIDVEEAIELLNIPAGKINLQRFIYWHIFKAYYRPDWSLEEMNHINFDWYRPINCHRQTPEQVKQWVEESKLSILKMDVQEAGITVIAQRSG